MCILHKLFEIMRNFQTAICGIYKLNLSTRFETDDFSLIRDL